MTLKIVTKKKNKQSQAISYILNENKKRNFSTYKANPA